MEEKPLFRLLLSLLPSGEREFEFAKQLRISPSSLTRHSQGLLRRTDVLKRAAQLFGERIGVEIEPDELLKPVSARTLIEVLHNGVR